MSPSQDVSNSPPQTEGVTASDFTTNQHVIPIEPDKLLIQSDQALLMKFHEQLGHCSFTHLKSLAEQGIIPKKLAKVPPPKCPSCLYGRAHKKP